MYSKINEEVAKELVGKTIKGITQKDEDSLIFKFTDGSELETSEHFEPGADGGLYTTTKYVLKSSLEKDSSGGVLFSS